MATSNIYSAEWLDVVFSARNTAYGAYQLRLNNQKNTFKALLLGGSIFVSLIIIPAVVGHFKESPILEHTLETQYELKDLNTNKPEPRVIPPSEPPRPRVDQVKFPPMVAVPASQVTENPPTIEKLTLAEPGKETLAGDPTAGIVIDVPVGRGQSVEDKITAAASDSPVSTDYVQVLPSFPGGPEAWTRFLQGYHYPQAAVNNAISGTVYVSFVVEKDGTLTNIRVARDLGYGTGEEAVRLLQTSGKWRPGIQNGRPVRVAYTQPIRLNIQ